MIDLVILFFRVNAIHLSRLVVVVQLVYNFSSTIYNCWLSSFIIFCWFILTVACHMWSHAFWCWVKWVLTILPYCRPLLSVLLSVCSVCLGTVYFTCVSFVLVGLFPNPHDLCLSVTAHDLYLSFPVQWFLISCASFLLRWLLLNICPYTQQ